jgi:hypothetical protein
MRALRALVPAAVLTVVLVGGAAPSAAAPIRGRGLHAQAGFYASILGDGHARIQVLDHLCSNPAKQRRCTPIRPALERAIAKVVDRPITWVDQPDRHRGVFWILAPVRPRNAEAELRWAWRDLRPYGCFGGGQLSFGRERGVWSLSQGIQYEGCPASPARRSA